MTWSLSAAGHAVASDLAQVASDERELMNRLNDLLGDARWGISSSQFSSTSCAGTPGIPEPEPEPALPTLSPEAQITALQEQVAELKAALANQAPAAEEGTA